MGNDHHNPSDPRSDVFISYTEYQQSSAAHNMTHQIPPRIVPPQPHYVPPLMPAKYSELDKPVYYQYAKISTSTMASIAEKDAKLQSSLLLSQTTPEIRLPSSRNKDPSSPTSLLPVTPSGSLLPLASQTERNRTDTNNKHLRSKSQGRTPDTADAEQNLGAVSEWRGKNRSYSGNAHQENIGEEGDKGKAMKRISNFFTLSRSGRDSLSGEDSPKVLDDATRTLTPPQTGDGSRMGTPGSPKLMVTAKAPGIRVVTPPSGSVSKLNTVELPISRDQNSLKEQTTPLGLDGEQTGNAGVTSQANPNTSQSMLRKGIALFGHKHRGSDGSALQAWILECGGAEIRTAYDIGPLENCEKVPDLWNSQGDTLVYLSPPPRPTSPYPLSAPTDEPRPSFRINSSPLLFSCLSNYIQDCTEWEDRPPSPSSITSPRAREPDDLFLDLSHDGANIPQQDGSGIGHISPRIEQTVIEAPHKGHSSQEQPKSNSFQERDVPVSYKLYYPRVAAKAVITKHAPSLEVVETQKKKMLLDARNLFAFLDYKPLVCSNERINAFQVLEKIYQNLFIDAVASNLEEPSPFSPVDVGTHRGMSNKFISQHNSSTTPILKHTEHDLAQKLLHVQPYLEHYIITLRLDDVREMKELESSLNKDRLTGLRDAMEAIYVAEKWRNARLYIEGFIHTAARWEEIKKAEHPAVEHLNPTTLKKLDRAKLDLDKREESALERLKEFAYPAMWTGVAKYPEFKLWRNGFADTRKLLLAHLKYLYGCWPPRAGKRGKGGIYGGERGGLNRLVLKQLEEDVGEVWSAIVDWDTPRYPPGGYAEDNVDATGELDDGRKKLRDLMEEFDRAVPPVQPRPMFDMPKIPGLSLLSPGDSQSPGENVYIKVDKKEKKDQRKKWQREEILQLLEESYNYSKSELDPGGFLLNFKQMELHQAQHCKTPEELAESRKGRWMFIYAVLQSLPMLTVDAPAVRWTEGVEYYLCVSYKGSLPWEVKEVNKRGRGSNRVASMIWTSSTDPLQMGSRFNHSVGSFPVTAQQADDEIYAIYERSFCWQRAAEWCREWEKKEEQRQMLEQNQLSLERWKMWEADKQTVARTQSPMSTDVYQQRFRSSPDPGERPDSIAAISGRGMGLNERNSPPPGSPPFMPRKSLPYHQPILNPLEVDQSQVGIPSQAHLLSPEEIFPESLLPSTASKRMSSYGYVHTYGVGYRSVSSPIQVNHGRSVSPGMPGMRAISMYGSAGYTTYQSQGSQFLPYVPGNHANTSPSGNHGNLRRVGGNTPPSESDRGYRLCTTSPP